MKEVSRRRELIKKSGVALVSGTLFAACGSSVAGLDKSQPPAIYSITADCSEKSPVLIDTDISYSKGNGRDFLLALRTSSVNENPDPAMYIRVDAKNQLLALATDPENRDVFFREKIQLALPNVIFKANASSSGVHVETEC